MSQYHMEWDLNLIIKPTYRLFCSQSLCFRAKKLDLQNNTDFESSKVCWEEATNKMGISFISKKSCSPLATITLLSRKIQQNLGKSFVLKNIVILFWMSEISLEQHNVFMTIHKSYWGCHYNCIMLCILNMNRMISVCWLPLIW